VLHTMQIFALVVGTLLVFRALDETKAVLAPARTLRASSCRQTGSPSRVVDGSAPRTANRVKGNRTWCQNGQEDPKQARCSAFNVGRVSVKSSAIGLAKHLGTSRVRSAEPQLAAEQTRSRGSAKKKQGLSDPRLRASAGNPIPASSRLSSAGIVIVPIIDWANASDDLRRRFWLDPAFRHALSKA
jgi:hypothetical protein